MMGQNGIVRCGDGGVVRPRWIFELWPCLVTGKTETDAQRPGIVDPELAGGIGQRKGLIAARLERARG